MRFGQAFYRITIPQWKECYINYEILKIFVSIIKILAENIKKCDETIKVVRAGQEEPNQIQVQDNLTTVLEELIQIRKQLKDYLVQTNKQFYRIFQIQIEIIELFYQMKTLQIQDRYRIIQRLKDQNFQDRKIELYLTYIQYSYIQISYLSEMREANLEAERKILKKHKKYAKKMTPTPIPNHTKIARMAKIQKDYTTKIQDLYVKLNKSIESKVARQFLRLAAQTEEASQRDYFFMGFGVGASIIVLGTLIFIIVNRGLSVENNSDFARDFPTWRGIGILILYVWVLGFNLYFFQKYKISHRLIFKFNDHHYSTSTDILKLAGIFTTVFLAFFLLYLLKITDVYSSGSGLGSQYYVLFVYGSVFIYLLAPLPIFNHKGRLYALRLTGLSLISPIVGMTFSIAWMTDQWISLSTPLRDLAYTVCYYSSLDFQDKEHNPCTDNSRVGISLVVIIIPILYRFMQCIRWGVADGFWWSNHMFNSIKYSISFCSAMLAYFYKMNAQLLPIWFAASAVNTVYSYYWDLKVDWNMLNCDSRNFLLRKYITFEPKRNYYIIFILNFVMRLSWTITLSPSVTSEWNPNLVTLITGSIEIIRRGIWNLLRVEREHINNCVEFKAIPNMRHIEQVLEQGMNTNSDIGVRNKQNTQCREIVKKQFIELIKKKLEQRQIQQKQYNSSYQAKNIKKAKKLGKQLKEIMAKIKKTQ